MKKKDTYNPYCDVCGGCGIVPCDGIEGFLDKHVKGKTNCKNEASFISEIIDACSEVDEKTPVEPPR